MSKAYGFEAYGGPETETWFDRPEPTPGPSEVVVRVKAAGVNPVDHKIRDGAMGRPEDATFPRVFGVEAAGVVSAVGEDVHGISVGDEVLGKPAGGGQGTYAEHAVLAADQVTTKPAGMAFTEAAALPVAGGTAWDALAALRLTEGDTLLINGAGGGVGVVATQLARDRGVAVFGVASEAKRALVESLGATLVAYDSVDVVTHMRELLPGGVSAVFDLVGGPSLREVAILVTDPARIVSVADPGVSTLGGSFVVSSFAGVPAVVELVAEGKLDPKVLQTYPFDEAAQALRAVESGHVLGKIVIDLERTTSA